ncbi:MAG: UDP-N-acetylglucosamine 2-epimerase (non-hydrolyzing) [Halorubrum sp.]|uniref:non-hydrolyzing UDP-N-acetylglucosamine 2-epimerase n=1 Tax=Halorubrum sp. TaxID=1879286 RepID=UPI003970846D
MTELAFVLGTVSEAIRLAPVIRACERYGVDHAVIDTGERRGEGFGRSVFEQFDLSEPDVTLDIGRGSDGEQTGMMLAEIERVLAEIAPDIVVVHGDANSTLAGAIAASKMDPEVAHVGAGFRSFDRLTPEETNRVAVDHVADYLFVPTDKNRWYLVREGITELRITVTGSTAVDALDRVRDSGRRERDVLDELGIAGNGVLLVSVHQRENVDEPDRFLSVLEGAARAGETRGLTVVYPVHPRARERLDRSGIDVPAGVRTIDPLEYADFVRLLSASTAVLTDSGCVQGEACVLGVPCVTVRNNTERAATTEVGANRLSQFDPDCVVRSVAEALDADAEWENPYGDGDAAERILDALPVNTGRREVVQQTRNAERSFSE